MKFIIFDTDAIFKTSPDAGHPDCICSRCKVKIKEGEIPFRLFDIDDNTELRYCKTCAQSVAGIDTAQDSDHEGLEVDFLTSEQTCKKCGCTDFDACLHPVHGPCWWVAPDLCSHCFHWPGESINRKNPLPL